MPMKKRIPKPKKKRKKLKRYVYYDIYGRRGRTILARNRKEAIRKAPGTALHVYSEEYLKKSFGRIPDEKILW